MYFLSLTLCIELLYGKYVEFNTVKYIKNVHERALCYVLNDTMFQFNIHIVQFPLVGCTTEIITIEYKGCNYESYFVVCYLCVLHMTSEYVTILS